MHFSKVSDSVLEFLTNLPNMENPFMMQPEMDTFVSMSGTYMFFNSKMSQEHFRCLTTKISCATIPYSTTCGW